MKILFRNKTYDLCKSCQTCEFYSIYLNGLWCELPCGELHWFGNKRIRPIKQDDIFKL